MTDRDAGAGTREAGHGRAGDQDPRAAALAGIAFAVFGVALELLFPAWVLALSVHVLASSFTRTVEVPHPA